MGYPHSAGACTCAHAARTEFFDVCGHSVTSYVGRQPLAESAPSALPFLSAVLNSVAETFVRPGRSALPVALLGRFQNSVRKPAETSHLSSSIVKCSIYSGFRLFILIQKECRGAVTKLISRRSTSVKIEGLYGLFRPLPMQVNAKESIAPPDNRSSPKCVRCYINLDFVDSHRDLPARN